MTTPDPRATLTANLRVMRAAELDVIRIMIQALDDIETQLRALGQREGIGARVREDQLRTTRTAILRRVQVAWARVGDVIRVQAVNAALAASAAADGYDEDFLRRLGLSRDEIRDFQASLARQAERSVDQSLNRLFDESGSTRIPLSEKVYNSAQLASGAVDNAVQSALARGLSAREFAQSVRNLIDPNVRGGVSYSAQRLARTEINNAFHYASLRRSENKPWVKGMKWNLSGSHPKVDICDALAGGGGQDGLPTGVYPIGSVPNRPHPNCLCHVTPYTMSSAEFERSLAAGQFADWQRENLPRA